jgi:protein O-mannosyl-transferase
MARTHRLRAAILAALAVGLYANTLGHGYALDDRVVIERNEFVQAGWAGIPELLEGDYLRGYLGDQAFDPSVLAQNPLVGGRYRVLSLVMFAVEHAVFGPGPFAHHLVQVLLYALCCAVLYRVLCELLADGPDERSPNPGAGFLSVPFVAALLFTAHPVHTEAVANLKSRDEILALLFALVTLWLSLRAAATGSRAAVIGAAGAFFLALISKESAITFLAVVPLSLWFFQPQVRAGYARAMPGLAIVAAAFLALRQTTVTGVGGGADLLNDPFLGASRADAFATAFYSLWRYLALLVWPHPLTHDYGPYHIAIHSWRDAGPWLGLFSYLGLAGLAASGSFTRSVPAFAAAFYLATLSIVSNLVVHIATFLGERFLFAPSVGAALGFAWGMLALVERAIASPRARAVVRAAAVLAIAGPLAAATMLRNPAWRDNFTLFTTDIAVSSESALANANLADVQLIRASETADPGERARLETEAVAHLTTALRIHPRYERALEMLSVAQGRRGDMNASLAAVEQLFAVNPRRGKVAFNAGTMILEHHPERSADAVRYLERAVEIQPEDADALANLGVAYYQTGDLARAIASFERAVALAPDRADHRANLEQLRAERR